MCAHKIVYPYCTNAKRPCFLPKAADVFKLRNLLPITEYAVLYDTMIPTSILSIDT